MEQGSLMTTAEVAKQLEIGTRSLGTYLSAHPDLRPARRVGFNYLWTPEEIERLLTFRSRPEAKGGRPSWSKNGEQNRP